MLNGSDLRDFIKERQAKQVRSLRQSWKVFPKLVIFRAGESKVVDTYVRLKKIYGEDILIDVEEHALPVSELISAIKQANEDNSIHGIIVQLPLSDQSGSAVSESQIDEILAIISPSKDVDGLVSNEYGSATATAINWLLAGYNVELKGKKIAIIGQGRLVGLPLKDMWEKSGYNVSVFDEETTVQMKENLHNFDIVVSAAGVPGIIKGNMLKQKAVVVDAGTASENGEIKGDVDESIREERIDLTITPKIGGVGPLTIAALFDNVINSARKIADEKGQQDL